MNDESLKIKARNFMIDCLQFDRQDFVDSAGEVKLTQLAENTAYHFKHDEWLDDELHWIWDLPIEVANLFDGD